MTVSPFDHPFLAGLFGDDELVGYFSADADIRAMLVFETALAKAEAAAGVIPVKAAGCIEAAAKTFLPNIDKLRQAVSIDGVVVPELVRQLREAVGGEHARHVHFGATSQDVIDTSLMLRLQSVLPVLAARLGILGKALAELNERFGSNRLMARTRMQPAIEISVEHRIDSWREPILRNRKRLLDLPALAVQFGGAVGTLNQLGDKAETVRAELAGELGLADRPQWHSQRDHIAELASVLSLFTGSIGKFGQDIALMAQAGSEIELSGGGGSSAMAHKQNPIAAETLITLARFNATQLSGIHNALVHEQERSGSAWMLEWLILPQMVCAAAASIRLATELTGNIRSLGTATAT